MITDSAVIEELAELARLKDGLVTAEDVVERARDENSAMHNHFDWNDTEAASKWRLSQARELLRVTVTFLGDGKKKVPMRVFVSLPPDRLLDGGGYRQMVTVLADDGLRGQLLKSALAEIKSFKTKYVMLTELTEVFDAMNKVIGSQTPIDFESEEGAA